MYKIVRYYLHKGKRTLESGVTLEVAQAHTQDPESSWKTCTLPSRKAITRKHGPWFDGFTKM